MYYTTDGERFDTIEDVLDYCLDEDYHDENDDYFEEWINENGEGSDMFGYSYTPYDILRAMDDGSWDEAIARYKNDMMDTDRQDAEYELEHAHDGYEVYIQAYIVTCHEGDPEEEEEDEENEENNHPVNMEITLNAIVELQRQKETSAKEEEKKSVDDYMNLFQHL